MLTNQEAPSRAEAYPAARSSAPPSFAKMKETGVFACDGCIFDDDVDLRGQIFTNASFVGACFRGRVHFDNARFRSHANFQGAEFERGVSFSNVRFTTSCSFEQAVFRRDVQFSGATCGLRVDLEGAKFFQPTPCLWIRPDLAYKEFCLRPASSSTPSSIHCPLHSDDEQKDDTLIRLELKRMLEEARLDRAGWVFPFDVDLVGRRIERADFRGSVFKETAFFREAQFAEEALFSGARFKDRATFEDAKFEEGANFEKVTFSGTAIFLDARFLDRMIFDEATFEKADLQSSASPDRHVEPDEEGIFRGCDLTDVSFRRCKMRGRALFGAHSIDKADYEYELERKISWSTAEFSRPDEFRRAERVCRGIRRSLEDGKHFRDANQTGYWEMEMRRMTREARARSAAGRIWANLSSLEGWYLLLSSHGTSLLRPLIWLVVLLLLAPFAFVLAGVELPHCSYVLPDGERGEGVGCQYNWSAWSLPGSWYAYTDLFGFSLRSAALLNDPQGLRLSWAAQVVQVTLRLAGPFLAFLFTLAVRRRFQR